VLVGGAMGGTTPRLASPLDVWLRPEQVVPFTLALLVVFREHGPREQRTKARLKWLLTDWGEEGVRAAVEDRLGYRLPRAGLAVTRRSAGDHLGVHRQRAPGYCYVGLHVPVGRVSAAQLAELGRLAAAHGRGEVRLTIDQNLVIPWVSEGRLPTLLAEPLLQDELRPDPPSIWRNLVCCTGSDYCHFSLIDTKSRALDLAQSLEARGVELPSGSRIHISGCINACGKHQIGTLGLLGTNVRIDGRVEEAVDVFVGGRLGPDGRLATRVRQGVLMDELAGVAEALLNERIGLGDQRGVAEVLAV
jgi:ferredoxin-nitrite reductase